MFMDKFYFYLYGFDEWRNNNIVILADLTKLGPTNFIPKPEQNIVI